MALHLSRLLHVQVGGDILNFMDFSILVDHRFLRNVADGEFCLASLVNFSESSL